MPSVLDRETIQRHLSLAERHVSEGGRRVARQREIVSELRNEVAT
jgi:hypothetical protein